MAEAFPIIFETPGTQTKPPSRFRPRRYHNKSRNGCFACKKRRVKCDEDKPECLQCIEKGLKCEFPPPTRPVRQTTRERSSSSESPVASLNASRDPLRPEIVAALDALGRTDPQYSQSEALHLIDHFQGDRDTRWLGGTWAQKILQDSSVPLALNAPYLLHSILALSAAHLSYLHPRNRKYSTAATVHYHRSLTSFSACLCGNLSSQNTDAMFSASTIHAILAFVHTLSPEVSTPNSTGHGATWVRPLQGMTILLSTPGLDADLRRGLWAPLVAKYDNLSAYPMSPTDDDDTSLSVREEFEQIKLLTEACTADSVEEQDMLVEACGKLRHLVPASCEETQLGPFWYFLATQQPGVTELWKSGDARALLILGFWCAFVSRVDQWWIVRPAKRECRRICDYVSSLGEPRFDAPIQFLLRFASDPDVGLSDYSSSLHTTPTDEQR